jgi:preprotein translocase subunit SecA
VRHLPLPKIPSNTRTARQQRVGSVLGAKWLRLRVAGVHVVTVNDYLAQRDAENIGQVGLERLLPTSSLPASRREETARPLAWLKQSVRRSTGSSGCRLASSRQR